MTDSSKWSGQINTEDGVIVWAHLFAMKTFKNKPDSKPRYEASFLFTKELFAPVYAKVQECAEFFYPGVSLADLKLGGFRNGDKAIEDAKKFNKTAHSFFADRMILSTHSDEKHPPEAIDMEGKPLMPNKIPSNSGGQIVRAAINIMPYDFNGLGITAYLNSVLLIQDSGNHPVYGDVGRIGGRSAADAFRDVIGKRATSDPSAGLGMEGL